MYRSRVKEIIDGHNGECVFECANKDELVDIIETLSALYPQHQDVLRYYKSRTCPIYIRISPAGRWYLQDKGWREIGASWPNATSYVGLGIPIVAASWAMLPEEELKIDDIDEEDFLSLLE